MHSTILRAAVGPHIPEQISKRSWQTVVSPRVPKAKLPRRLRPPCVFAEADVKIIFEQRKGLHTEVKLSSDPIHKAEKCVKRTTLHDDVSLIADKGLKTIPC